MPFKIVHNDITRMNVDAIVNAANSRLQHGGGVCGAIFAAAGATQLQKECDEIGGCPTGQAVVTGGYRLDAKYVIHAVGPVWQGGGKKEAEFLHDAYMNSLCRAKEKGCESIAFPLISAGIYGYPKKEALRIAIDTFSEFLMENEMDIYLVVFDKNVIQISEKLFADIEHYLDEYYEPEDDGYCNRVSDRKADILCMDKMLSSCEPKQSENLEALLDNLDETFSSMLLRLIDEKGCKDSEVYKKANVDRKLFSKIKNNRDYVPRKTTVLAFAAALELSLEETTELLGKAGYSLSRSSRLDVIVKYFIEAGEYDVFKINEALFCFDQPLLGMSA